MRVTGLKRLITIVAIAAGTVLAPPLAAQDSEWTAGEALKPCFDSGEGEEDVAQALAKCRELLGSARYGGEDAAMLRYAIINYQSMSATPGEKIEQLSALARESLPQEYQYGRDAQLAQLCYEVKRWDCVVAAIRPNLDSSYLTIDELSIFTDAMIQSAGAGSTQALGTELIQKRDKSAVGYLLRAEGRTKGDDKAGAIEDFLAAGDRLPKDNPVGLNTVCWQLVTTLGAAEKARSFCDIAAAGSPLDWAVWDSHGAMNLALKRYTNAWADYELAVRLEPKAAHALYGRGLALERLGQTEAGEKDKQAALAIDPDVAKDYAGYGL